MLFDSHMRRAEPRNPERYIKPFGGGYDFVLPGISQEDDILAKGLFD